MTKRFKLRLAWTGVGLSALALIWAMATTPNENHIHYVWHGYPWRFYRITEQLDCGPDGTVAYRTQQGWDP